MAELGLPPGTHCAWLSPAGSICMPGSPQERDFPKASLRVESGFGGGDSRKHKGKWLSLDARGLGASSVGPSVAFWGAYAYHCLFIQHPQATADLRFRELGDVLLQMLGLHHQCCSHL